MPTHRPKDVNHSLLHCSFYPCMVEIRNHNFGWHQFPEVLPFSFSSTPPLSSVTKARHNLLTGIMELLIINVIFSSFPKIYSELSSAGGTRHISQSNLPQKSSRQLSLDVGGKKREAEINTSGRDHTRYPASTLYTCITYPSSTPLNTPSQAEILVSYKDTLILRCMQAYHVLHCLPSLLALC